MADSGARRSRRRWVRVLMSTTALVMPLALMPVGGAEATYEGPVGRLAFGISVDSNVDIYTAKADGSGLQRLTEDASFDACAAYSPSGRQVAFCSDRSGDFEIWTMGAGGEGETQLTDLEGRSLFPDFSPSGHNVAFGGSHDPEGMTDIWRIRDDGTHLKRLTYTPSLADAYPVWRPGHEQIAFLRLDDPYIGSQVWLMDADGGHQRPLTFDDTAKDQLPDWSPDGSRLAYNADGDIWVMRADGSHQRNLTQSDADEFGAAWSPDGRRIAFVRDQGATRPVYTMAADGTDEQILLEGNTNPQFVPAWQPAPRDLDCTPRVRDLGTLGGLTSEVLAMNGHGLVVGSARNSSGVNKAVIWRRGQIDSLGVRGEGWAADVNERGVVVGNFADEEHAFVWRRGEAQQLPGLGGDFEYARRINEHNDIVGSATGPKGSERPVMWRHGRPHDLGIPAGYDGAVALGINDSGDVVGAAYRPGQLLAWAWPAEGGNHPLDRLGGFSQANVIDNAGRAMGLSDLGGNPGGYAALWSGRHHIESLGVFGSSDFSFALGTSGHEDAVGVGTYYAGEDAAHVFVRRVPNYDVVRSTAKYPLQTLMPLSGDPSDESGAHAVLRSNPPLAATGSVTVGGQSATGVGRQVHATLWTCAYRQAFVPDEQLTTPPSGARNRPEAGLVNRLDFDRMDRGAAHLAQPND